MKKAVITGATGFLGYALVRELIQNGIYVYALCRRGSSRISRLQALGGIKVIEADFNSASHIEEAEGSDVFYHLAWEGGRNDFDAQYRNVALSVNCLKLASNLGCRRFICTGSQAEYGHVAGAITEETPLNPTTAYGACKAAAYYLTADLAKRLDIEHTWARVFSVYGPNDNQNTLIMMLIRDLTSKGEARLDTDGKQIWNYLHESDAARALRLLGNVNSSNTVYNVASRDSKPLKEFVEILRGEISETAAIHYGSVKSPVNLNVDVGKLIGSIGEYECNRFSEFTNNYAMGEVCVD